MEKNLKSLWKIPRNYRQQGSAVLRETLKKPEETLAITDSKVVLSLGKHQKSLWKIPSDYGQQSNAVLTI